VKGTATLVQLGCSNILAASSNAFTLCDSVPNSISAGAPAAPDHAVVAYSAPQTPSWIKGPTSKRRGG